MIKKLNIYPPFKDRFGSRVHPDFIGLLFCSNDEHQWLECVWVDQKESDCIDLSFITDIGDKEMKEWNDLYDHLAEFDDLFSDESEVFYNELNEDNRGFFSPQNDIVDEAKKWLLLDDLTIEMCLGNGLKEVT